MRAILLAAVALAVVLPSCCKPKPTKPTKVDLGSLLIQYRDGAIAADQNWRGVRIETEGRVVDMGRNVDGLTYVMMNASGHIQIPSLRCFVANDLDPKLAQLRNGNRAKAIGVVGVLTVNLDASGCVVEPI